jgi:arylsulfatase A-like enzyme
MDEDLRPAPSKYTRPACKQQCMGAMRLVDMILSTLQRIDAYDNTMILIVGDHGARRAMPVNMQLLGHAPTKFPKDNLQNIKSSALPLVLVKPFGSRGPLRISKAPVSLGDVAKTIASETGIGSEFPGESMLALAENQERERRFFHYEGFDWKTPFPTITEYRVDGFSWLDESWHPTTRILAAGTNTNGSPGVH